MLSRTCLAIAVFAARWSFESIWTCGEMIPAIARCGSHAILGDKVFANVMAPTTRPEEGAHYETHHRYHDLQIDVEGRESFKVSQGETTLVEPFNEADDFELGGRKELVSPAIWTRAALRSL